MNFKYGGTPYHYCLKEDFLAMELNDEALYDMMEENFELFKTVHNDKLAGKNTTNEDYVKVPIFDVNIEYDENSDEKEFICLKLATWIFTYSKRHNLADLKVIAKSLDIEKDLIVEAVKEYGEQYLLTYTEGKRGYRRTYHVNFDKNSFLGSWKLPTLERADEVKKIDESKILQLKVK